MIWKVNLKNVGSCWWWFRNGAWITGGGIAMGMGLEYFVGNTWRDREREGKVKVMGE